MTGPWSYQINQPTPEPPAAAGWVRSLLSNLRTGLRVAGFRPVGRRQFVIRTGQAWLFLAAAAAAALAYSAIRWGGISSLGDAVESGWLTRLFASCLLTFVIAYAISAVARDSQGVRGFAVIVIGSALVPASSLIAIIGVMEPLLRVTYSSKSMEWLYDAWYVAYFVAVVWCLSTFARSLRITYRLKGLQPALLSMLLIGAFLAPDLIKQRETENEAAAESEEDESDVSFHLDVESTYYAQQGLLEKAAAHLAAQRPGISDLYFIGFGSYASQNVFRSEVEKVTRLFAERFDAGERSVSLINNVRTAASVPLASVINLKHILPEVAKRMNKDEDILFLFLTSHGSPGILSVDFPPLFLRDLHADELKAMLDDSGIKWRVVVVSACYSGSFIEPLKNENTLVITAARADRTSFGCSNENEFTYFGDAYFNGALRRDRSFIAAFEEAKRAIAAREAAGDLTPSEPQIYVGAAIRARLEELESRLNAMGAAASGAAGRASTDLGSATR